MALAPIFMTTYRRLDHLKKSLESLARNPLASESTIYLTSDGPLPEHKKEVFAVRNYLENLEGFGRVELHFFDQNHRGQLWDLRREVSEKHGRFIFLEEDCVTAPGFLGFLNASLVRWKDDPAVFGIVAFTPPLPELAGPEMRAFRVPCANVWGFGTWERNDRIIRKTMPKSEVSKTLRSHTMRAKAFESLGAPFLGMLGKAARGQYFGYDIMANYEIIQRDMVCIYPSQSLIRNTGFDGTGEHCGTSDNDEGQLYDQPRERWDDLKEVTSKEVNRAFGRFHGTSARNRWRFYSRWLRGKL